MSRTTSTIRNARISRLSAELKQPFAISSGATSRIDNLLFAVTLADGSTGFGEAAAATRLTGKTREMVESELREAIGFLRGLDGSNYLRILGELEERIPGPAAAAIGMALVDALSRHWKIPVRQFFGARESSVRSDITVVIGDADEAEEFASSAYGNGFRHFKIKTGRDEELDMERIRRVAAATRHAPLVIDANQAWTSKQSLRILKKLRRHGVIPVLLEQPVHRDDFDGLAEVTRGTKVLVCADESIFGPPDFAKLIRKKAADVINIKLMKSGVIRARELALLARAHGIGLMIGGMVESEIAMTFSAHFAAGLGGFGFVDLDIPWLMRSRVTSGFAPGRGGLYDLSRVASGTGLVPSKRRN